MISSPSLLKGIFSPLSCFVLCTVTVVLIWVAFTSTSLDAGDGEVIMPLDDAYIHFQYARQIATGDPYVYNPGDPPTSGATSFIYPYLLAIGYALGFTGLNLGLWAMGIGVLSFLVSVWLVVLIARAKDAPHWLAFVVGITFAVSGPISWHFLSGMETGLIVTLVLASLYSFVTGQVGFFITATTLLALTRPEGSIMAVIAAILMGTHLWLTRPWPAITQKKDANVWPKNRLLWLVIPLLAILVQPLVNWTVTGSLSASGTQAKSIFGTIPFYWDDVLGRIWSNWTRMWREFATGTSGAYTPVIVAPLAIIGLANLFVRRRKDEGLIAKTPDVAAGILIFAWFVVVSAAISTLDTAFWHFKRYQTPLVALLYPLAAWGIVALWEALRRHLGSPQKTMIGLSGSALVIVGLVGMAIPTAFEFHRLYKVNVDNIAAQPLPMARWLNQNTPDDAVIAVHDVGMMRYIGDRYTIDMVGLTTPGAAEAWRNGPGSVAQFLMAHEPAPDFVAAYTTARGLKYLEQTSIYGELLAEFPADYAPEDNVALAADFQGIYRVDWHDILFVRDDASPLQPSILDYLQEGSGLLQRIDVAAAQEAMAQYEWENRDQSPGFVTEVYELSHVDCVLQADCVVLDGGRRINGEESFIPRIGDTQGPSSVLLVTRLHPAFSGTLDFYVNGEFAAKRWLPQLPGNWLEIAAILPNPDQDNAPEIRVVPNISSGFYMPYYHFIFDGEALKTAEYERPIATFQDGSIGLVSYRLQPTADSTQSSILLDWQTDGSATGDYKLFAHLYDNIAKPPVAQTDVYPGNGTLPPGNWLPGIRSDTIAVDTAGIPPGEYQIAIGFYDPFTLERLPPMAIDDSVWVDENSRRLFIGTIEVVDDE